jgi:Na+-driven multidrug efflux pump
MSKKHVNIARQKNEKDPRLEFLNHPLGRLISKNALPAIASMLFIAFYQAVDGIMVGRKLGPEALASVNILYPVVAVFAALALMLAVGGNARIAVLLGSGETKKARSTLGLVVAIGIGLGLFGSLAIHSGLPYILAILGTSGSLGILAGDYLKMLYPFFTLMILQLILEQSVRNDGKPYLATAVMACSAVLNIALDYLFLYIFEMGIAGAALATGIAQSVGALVFVTYFLRKTLRRQIGLRFAAPSGGFAVIRTIAVNGSSEMLGSLAVGLTTFLFNRSILLYAGAIELAAFSVVQYLLMFGLTVFMGLSNGIQPIISYNHGAGQVERVRGILTHSLGAAIAVGFAIFLLLRSQAETMAAFFVAGHPQALAATVEIASAVSWALLFMPFGIILTGFFTALEEAGKSLIMASSRSLICNVLGLVFFPVWWGAEGIWFTPVFAESVTAIAAFALYGFWLSKTLPAKNTEQTLAELG